MGKCSRTNIYNAIVSKLSRELFNLCKELSNNPNYKEYIWEIYEEFKQWLNTKAKYTS